MRTARWGHSAVIGQDGRVLIIGGFGFNALRTTEVYVPVGGGWFSRGGGI